MGLKIFWGQAENPYRGSNSLVASKFHFLFSKDFKRVEDRVLVKNRIRGSVPQTKGDF